MNWVEGEPLDEWVRRRPDRDPFDALKLLLGVASALDLMHSGRATGGIPVVHRDVKPSNIVVTDDGTVLVDFGLTRGLPDGARLSGVMGTPGYLAPEAADAGIYTPAADRYALGAVAYFVLTGSEPPTSHQPEALRSSLAEVPALAERPEAVDQLMAMLDAEPGTRPAVLTNWVGQLRRSSLAAGPEVLAPEAPARHPQPGSGHRPPPSQLPTRPAAPTMPRPHALPIDGAAPVDSKGPRTHFLDRRRMVPALGVVVLALLVLSVAALTFREKGSKDIPGTASSPSAPPSTTTTTAPGPAGSGRYRDLVLATPGLISYWRMGESSGNQAYDQKRQGFNGEYIGRTVGLGQPGIPGGGEDKSVRLDGYTAYLRIQNDPTYNVDAFTVEMWVYLDSYGNTSCFRDLITKGVEPRDRSFGLYLKQNSAGTVQSSFGPEPPIKENFVGGFSSQSLALGAWYHLALTHPAAGSMTLYINGTPERSSALAGSPVTSTAPIIVGNLAPIRIDGQSSNAIPCPTDPATRLVDELALYRVALTSDQVQEHFRAG